VCFGLRLGLHWFALGLPWFEAFGFVSLVCFGLPPFHLTVVCFLRYVVGAKIVVGVMIHLLSKIPGCTARHR
jgi:hypothetical protein